MGKINAPYWKIWVDTGGTFTDCLAIDSEGIKTRLKVLSSGCVRGRIVGKVADNTFQYAASWPFEAGLLKGYTLRVLENGLISKVVLVDSFNQTFKLENDLPFSKNTDFEIFSGEEAPVLAARLLTKTRLSETLPALEMRLGTTKGTNALLERKGAKTLLVVTKSFKDLLYIGNQQRPSLFQLDIPEPRVLYSEVLEVDERLDASGNVIHDLHVADLTTLTSSENADSIAISLLHSYQNNAHELLVERAFCDGGAKYVSVSSKLFPFSHYLRRTQTAVVNAYLYPVLDQYLTNIKNSLGGSPLGECSLKVMTSTGSLSEVNGFRAKDSLLSGPAGGMVAAANAGKRLGFPKTITFDMGGTSTDTALIDGRPELKYVTEIDGIEFHNPTLAIETVAAGGGSICWFDGFSLQVGPESAGASPGPACYGAGGPLTITDVNLLLGKLDASKFGIPVRADAAMDALIALQNNIKTQTGNSLSFQELLSGLESIANEKMADAIRKISVEKGINPADFALITFGGAGGLHSCQLADLLDIKTVIIPYDAGLFSAVGMGEALISTIVSKQILLPWRVAEDKIEHWKNELLQEGAEKLQNQAVNVFETAFCYVYLRFAGQENTIEVNYDGAETLSAFKKLYTAQFGYYPANLTVELESLKLMVQERAAPIVPETIIKDGLPANALRTIKPLFQTDLSKSELIKTKNFDSENAANLFEWDQLDAGDQIIGPAILLNSTSTAYIPNGWKLIIQNSKDAVAFKTSEMQVKAEKQSEEIALQLFTNRFKSIADEMGVQLQRTAFSVNVKERLDFSCALLDQNGELLVNAQHIPVHLGSMGICGRLVKKAIEIGPGDVVITNHPKYGGSHLPDITLISGIFTAERECVGYVINRAHHAEVGGKTPGSMPPDATCLAEEGVIILPQYLIKKNVFQWDAIRSLFTEGPFPTRHFLSNEADIIAALSALRKGSEQMLKLVDLHGLETVRKYMTLLKKNAVAQLETALMSLHGQTFEATELLDDGHKIQVVVSIAREKQVFDFTGTSKVHPNNLNANISILYSAILYVLRLLVNKEIPLNDGLMKNVDIILPENSFLHPDFSDDPFECPAVVGGNTEVSQRLVDTLLKAFGLAACSQGTMNNFLFGDEQFGYYETIGGGTGAGPGFHGRSAVHQHMTNTRITDPEQLERKYPVRLLEFGIRKNSGGKGTFNGGDGIVRKFEFLKPLQVTLMGQHRKYAPYGLNGGEDGKCGAHTLISGDETSLLHGICSLKAKEGDILVIETPGGGGFG
ncbi:hydantoinase B/oxoprolinase family protein [Dyadobacter fanqingshengii]|uniref:Hydantoinase B/oxoprolinase family protein n=1 Tax=Dyadobacter fanqingshengii TaxID=2906443 RepID=A0A9X1P8S4_9BACT|nr:hydantoinase B/oxoprolinase family protein [Dyadobacter fanqingshengii]MCF0038802.1 hydantoinase B/oxoprolinase family protein [Dyadobacter fanqingshengii]USJ34370.1 hydantoinase B/oxoprolinase family protein [Dyadobacter fanqingshengii]